MNYGRTELLVLTLYGRAPMVSGIARICLCRAIVNRNSTDHSFIHKTKSKLKIRKTYMHKAKCFKFYKRKGKAKELKQKY
jgi:hypothetical protein